MRTFLILFSVILFSACQLAPDSFNISSRLDQRGNYNSTQFGVVYNNPWKPRQVHEEYITTEGGLPGGELP